MTTKDELDAAISSTEAAVTLIESTIRSLDTWVLVFAALVAVGVLGESVLGIWHWLKDRELRPLRIAQSQLHEKELELLRNDTETAKGESAKSIERAGLASAEAAKANENAAAANERAAEIMKATAWRQFDPGQRQIISAALSKRVGKVRLIWIANDPESLGLARQFVELLNAAHWA